MAGKTDEFPFSPSEPVIILDNSYRDSDQIKIRRFYFKEDIGININKPSQNNDVRKLIYRAMAKAALKIDR